ncbi:MAG: flagellar brake protein [Gammaproteobacteria bacterium]
MPRTSDDLDSFAQTNTNDNPSHICALLRRMLDQRCLLTVQIGAQPNYYTSAILEVVHEYEYVVLDELTPADGHHRLKTDSRIHVRAVLDGLDVRFSSRVTQINTQDGLPYYKVPFPAHIDYPQRRQAERVPIPLQLGLPTSILLPDDRVLSGELRDISPGGMGMRVRLGVPIAATDCGHLAICQIIVDRDRDFVTDIEVCHIDRPVRGRVPRLGGRFVHLHPDQASRIEAFCAELAQRRSTAHRAG